MSLVLAVVVVILSARLFEPGHSATDAFWRELHATLEAQGVTSVDDLEAALYGGSSAAGLDFSDLLYERREKLCMSVHDAIFAVHGSTGRPLLYISKRADRWFRSEATDNETWAAELVHPYWNFAAVQTSHRTRSTPPRGYVFTWEPRVTCPAPRESKQSNKTVLFAGTTITLAFDGVGTVTLQMLLDPEDVPGHWSRKLADELLAEIRAQVDLEQRGVEVEVRYK